MNQIRKDINLITESIKIDEAWQELPGSVREDLTTLVSELSKLNEAALAPEQIQSVLQSLVTTRGEGGNTAQIAKKAQLQLTPLFAKITGNPKLKAILSKVGNAVPIEKLKVLVAKLPDPAGKNASAVVASIQKGAQSIENDEDVAAFKGLMMTVITIGMGVAGAGGPAVLGIIGTTAIFRTVVDSAIKAAAGGTVADIAKAAGTGLAKGAIAGLAGSLLGGLGDVEVSGDEQLMSASLPTQAIDVTAPLEDAGMSMEEIDQFIANMQADDAIMQRNLFPEFFDEMENDVITSMDKFNVGPEYAEKYENMMSASATVDGSNISMGVDNFGSSMGVLFNPEEYAEYNDIVAQNGGGTDGLFSEEATAFRDKIAGEINNAGAEVGGDATDMSNLAPAIDKVEAEFEADTSNPVAVSNEQELDQAVASQEAKDIQKHEELYKDVPGETPKPEEVNVGSDLQQQMDAAAKEASRFKSESNYMIVNGVKYQGQVSEIGQSSLDSAGRVASHQVLIKAEMANLRNWGNGGEWDFANFPEGPPVRESFVHPELKNVLSEEVGEDFDALVEQVGEKVAVFVMLEWYNKHIKDTKVIIEGMEHLQEHRLIENIEQTMSEAPDLGGIAKKVGGAYKTAVGKVGQAAKAVGGAVVNTVIKPIINSAPVKAFTNKLTALVGMQGKIDPEKLQTDYAAAESPTESDDVAKFLQKNAGATKEEVDASFKAAGIEAVSPEEEAEPEEQPQAGGEQPQAGGEQPQAGQEQPQADANQDGKDDATGAPITPQGTNTPATPQTDAQGTTSGAAGGSAGGQGAIQQGVQQAKGGAAQPQAGGAAQPQAGGAAPAPADGETPAGGPSIDDLVAGKTTATHNKIKFTWDGAGWKNDAGQAATGSMQQQLFKQHNLNGDGTPLKKGFIGRAKDYISGKTPGLAQATRSDPNASTGKKLAGMAGAAIGGIFGKSGGGKPGEPGTPEEPGTPVEPGTPGTPEQPGQPEPAPGAEPKADAPAQLKAVPGPTTAELKALQSKTLQGDLASAKALVAKLSELKTKGYDADNFIQSAAPAMKRGGIAKTDPQAYATFAKMARSMRAEAYEHMCAILEHAGLTWADIGYEVLISESVTSHVMLIPIDVVQMAEMKKLAGI